MRVGVFIYRTAIAIMVAWLLLVPAARAQATTEATTQPALAGTGKIVALDYFYNHQVDKDGKQFAYIWEDTGPLGYSQFGEVWGVKRGE